MQVNATDRPRVVIIRGDWLSRRDTQYYNPLMDRYDLLGVSVRRTIHDLSLVKFQVISPWSPDSLLAMAPPLQWLLDRAFRLRSENLMYFWGLDRICQAASIIDVAETFHPFCAQAVRLKQRYGCKLVVRAHENIPFAHHNLSFRRRTKRAVFEYADAFITCSELGRHALMLEGAPPEKINVIPMGTDIDHFTPSAKNSQLMEQLGLSEHHFVLLFVGRMVWEKGVLDILNALCILRRDLPSLRVVFVGGGQMSELKRWIAERDLVNSVVVAGSVPATRVRDFYSLADVVLVPSIATPKWQEQFGGVLIEAMACGKAIIASDSGSIPEVVGDVGVIVPQANYVALAQAVERLFHDHPSVADMRLRARERAVTEFSNEVVAGRIGEIYRSLT